MQSLLNALYWGIAACGFAFSVSMFFTAFKCLFVRGYGTLPVFLAFLVCIFISFFAGHLAYTMLPLLCK